MKAPLLQLVRVLKTAMRKPVLLRAVLALSFVVSLVECQDAVVPANNVICHRVDESSDPRQLVRFTCSGPSTRITSFMYDAVGNRYIVGATSKLLVFDSTLRLVEEISLADKSSRANCVARCKQCATRPTFVLKACGSNSSVCPKPILELCENVPLFIRPVTVPTGDGASTVTFVLTCSTHYADSNSTVNNCNLRQLSNLTAVTDEFQAQLSLRSDVPYSQLTLGNGLSAGIDQSGRLTGPVFTAGYAFGQRHVPFIHQSPGIQMNWFDFSFESSPVLRRTSSTPARPVGSGSFALRLGSQFPMHAALAVDDFIRYHLQYIFHGYVYLFVSNVEVVGNGSMSHGAYIWRYGVNDTGTLQTPLPSVQRIGIACTGTAYLRGYTSEFSKTKSTSRWEMRNMASAIEVPFMGWSQEGSVLVAFNTLRGDYAEASSICSYTKVRIASAFDSQDPRYGRKESCSQSQRMGIITSSAGTTPSTINYTLYQEGFFSQIQGRPVPNTPTWFSANVLIEKLAFARVDVMFYIFATAAKGRVLQLGCHVLPPAEGFVMQQIDEFYAGKADPSTDVNITDIQIVGQSPAEFVVVATQSSVETRPVVACRAYSSNCSSCLGLQGSYVDHNCVWCEATSTCQFRKSAECPGEVYPPFSAVGKKSIQTCRPDSVSDSGFRGRVTQNPAPLTVRSLGESATLTCVIFGPPAFSITWHRNGAGHAIQTNETHFRTQTQSGAQHRSEQFLTSRLIISNINAGLGGVYSCRGVSGFRAINSANATLHVRPHIQSAPSSIALFRGQAAILSCNISAYPPVSYKWFKDGELLRSTMPNASVQFCQRPNQLVVVPTISKGSSLYTCSGSNAVGVVHAASARVQVVDAARASSSVVLGQAGREIVLTCPLLASETNGTSSISWYLENNLIVGQSGSTYRILDPKISQRGLYRCQVTVTTSRQVVSHAFLLQIPSVPRIVSSPTSTLSLPVGATTQLNCKVDASEHPLPVIVWSFTGYGQNQSLLRSSGNVILTSNNQVLHLVNIQPRQTGMYSCSVANRLGQASASWTISVVPSLAIVQPPVPTELTDSLKFRCVIRGPPGTKGYYTFQGAPVVTGKDVRVEMIRETPTTLVVVLHVDFATPNNLGSYQCIGEHASSKERASSTFVVFRTKCPKQTSPGGGNANSNGNSGSDPTDGNVEESKNPDCSGSSLIAVIVGTALGGMVVGAVGATIGLKSRFWARRSKNLHSQHQSSKQAILPQESQLSLHGLKLARSVEGKSSVDKLQIPRAESSFSTVTWPGQVVDESLLPNDDLTVKAVCARSDAVSTIYGNLVES